MGPDRSGVRPVIAPCAAHDCQGFSQLHLANSHRGSSANASPEFVIDGSKGFWLMSSVWGYIEGGKSRLDGEVGGVETAVHAVKFPRRIKT